MVLVACGDNRVPEQTVHAQCSDGVDNDADGLVDFPNDPGCNGPDDESEDSTLQPACSDGRDNDGDGKIDYPADPGCAAPNQDDETDDCPNGPHCPQCANGIDDDLSGEIDYPDDPGCTSAADTEENTPNPFACGGGLTIMPLPVTPTDTITFDGTSLSGLATSCGGGHNAPAVAYEIHLAKPMILTASTDDAATTADTVLDLRSAMCSMDAAEMTCSDDIDANTKASRIVASLQPGKYYLIVEGYDTSEIGKTAVLHVKLQAGEGAACTMTSDCGDGLVCRVPLHGSELLCEKPMCSDGVDDDGDLENDYPDDPGCATPDDNDESDTCPGAGCPVCSDGIDNDGDGHVDYPDDTSCASAAGSSEACNGEQDPIGEITSGTLSGTLVGTHDDHDPTCGGNGGVDRLYTLTIPALQTLTIDTEGTVVDTVLSLMSPACTEPSLHCDDDGGVSTHASLLTFNNISAGTYVVAVDAYSSSTTPDTFALHVAGTLHPGASCEPDATLGGAFACPAANPCEGTVGSQICRPSQCNNGMDDDGDGKTDYPNEPGCTGPDDNDETDTCPGAGCPQCGDGIDNDADGATDYPADTTCTSASGSREGCDTEPVPALVAASTAGTTVGATNDINPTCASSSGSGPDRMYRVDVPQLTALSINLTASYDSVHELLGATCGGAPLACSDPLAMNVGPVAAGTYYLVIDGYSSSSSGTYTVNLSGTIANGESCESALAVAGALQCATGATCAGMPGSRVCQGSTCSDGVDNDGDGLTDYPNDPGCDSPADDDETDTCPGAGCPVCANTMDDDGDTKTDYAMDPSCWAASGTDEGFCTTDTDRAQLVYAPTMTGTTSGLHSDYATQSCQANASGNDVAFALVLPVPVASLSIDTNTTSFDTVLSFRNSTCATEIACDDDGGDSVQSLITRTNVAAGSYAIVVDGYNAHSGPYTLHVHGTVANGTACTSPLFTTHVLDCTAPATCIAGTCQ